METLFLESVLAVTGCIQPEFDDKTVAKAMELADKQAKRLTRWLVAPTLNPFELPRQYKDADKLWEQVGRPVQLDATMQLDVVPAQEYQLMLTAARKAVAGKYPLAFSKDLLQDWPLPPSEDQIQDWYAFVGIVEDEDRVLDEIEMGTITPELVEFFRQTYPARYQALKDAVDTVLIDFNAKGIQLHQDAESTMEIFMGLAHEPGLEIAPEEPQEPAVGNVKLEPEGAQTSAERSAQK